MKKSVLIYSGGLDSTVLLCSLLDEGRQLKALGFDYGQRHKRELAAGASIAADLGVDYRVVELPLGSLLVSALTRLELDVPEGHYEDENMKRTVVPNRNMIMLAIAIGYCSSIKFDSVCFAVHTGDHAIYPDCRPEFVAAMKKVARLCDWRSIEVEAPLLSLSKADIVVLGSRISAPFAQTWTCYLGLDKHCGKCGSCIERREAFMLAGVEDPTQYIA